MVVCAPTGSGKTVVFELAIVRLLMNVGVDLPKIKIVYSKCLSVGVTDGICNDTTRIDKCL